MKAKNVKARDPVRKTSVSVTLDILSGLKLALVPETRTRGDGFRHAYIDL
jgi:hypothetical protein